MGFWTVRTHDPIAPMRERAYNEFKVIDLDRGNSIYAWQVVAWVSRKPYDIFGRNCMDITYDVLRAFGVPHLPAPAHHWEPNHWFNHVQGRHYRIDAADVALEADVRGRSPVDLELPDIDSVLSSPPQGIEPAQPRWRTVNTPEWLELHAAMAAAPAMPATGVRDTQAARHGIIAKIRRFFGVGLRD